MNNRQKGERMETRSTKANHVSRNLFGAVDHDNLQQDFQHMLYTSMEKAKQKWNFDFLQEIPVEGQLQWEELQVCEVPSFYCACMVGDARRPLQPLNQAVIKEPKGQHSGKAVEKLRSTKTAGRRSLVKKKRRQTTLTDYYVTKKQIRVEMQTPVKKTTL